MSKYLLESKNEALEKTPCMTPWKEDQAILLLKLRATIWGIFCAKCGGKKHFLETDRKFQSTGNRTGQISAFRLVFGGYQLEVITWDRDCCSASGLGQVAIGQMSLWQTHQEQSWR